MHPLGAPMCCEDAHIDIWFFSPEPPFVQKSLINITSLMIMIEYTT